MRTSGQEIGVIASLEIDMTPTTGTGLNGDLDLEMWSRSAVRGVQRVEITTVTRASAGNDHPFPMDHARLEGSRRSRRLGYANPQHRTGLFSAIAPQNHLQSKVPLHRYNRRWTGISMKPITPSWTLPECYLYHQMV